MFPMWSLFVTLSLLVFNWLGADVGREQAVEAVRSLESNVGVTNVKPNLFRGAESLITPDVKRIFHMLNFMGHIIVDCDG